MFFEFLGLIGFSMLTTNCFSPPPQNYTCPTGQKTSQRCTCTSKFDRNGGLFGSKPSIKCRSGQYCKQSNPPVCSNNDPCAGYCKNGGKGGYDVFNGGCYCDCPSGYTGNKCQTAKKCTKGKNGKSCQNGGSVTGNIADSNCGCSCPTGFSGANCENKIKCTKGKNGKSCQNGGSVTGNIADNNCGCSCLTGFSGANCQNQDSSDCPIGLYGSGCENGFIVDDIAEIK